MYDFTNYQIADIPVFMWSMVGVTAALIGYVTVSSNSSMTSMPSMPSMPSASSAQSLPQFGGRKTRRKKVNKSKNSK